MRRISLLLLVSLLSISTLGRAGDFVEDQPGSSTSIENTESTFDPFADYSEFEEGSEEESDVNFFHNGRFFSVGVLGGAESFTSVLGNLYKPGFAYGLFLSYFFDLKLSLQIAYVTADHSIDILDAKSATEYLGKVTLSHFEFNMKYYLDTQNVTRGLGAINPYLLLGFSSYSRNQTFNGAATFARDNALGFQAGGGVELPFSRNSMFFGGQLTYNYISFPDRGTPITINGVSTGINPTGDDILFLALIGINF